MYSPFFMSVLCITPTVKHHSSAQYTVSLLTFPGLAFSKIQLFHKLFIFLIAVQICSGSKHRSIFSDAFHWVWPIQI